MESVRDPKWYIFFSDSPWRSDDHETIESGEMTNTSLNGRMHIALMAALLFAAVGRLDAGAADGPRIPGTWDLDVSMGLAFPQGDFSSTVATNPQAGGARRGPSF